METKGRDNLSLNIFILILTTVLLIPMGCNGLHQFNLNKTYKETQQEVEKAHLMGQDQGPVIRFFKEEHVEHTEFIDKDQSYEAPKYDRTIIGKLKPMPSRFLWTGNIWIVVKLDHRGRVTGYTVELFESV